MKTLQNTPRAAPRALAVQDVPPVRNYPFRISVPTDLRDSIGRTIGYALDFILNTLDFSPDETVIPANEGDLRTQPSGDPLMHDQFSVIVWNDDKHSFDEVIQLLHDITQRTREEASEVADRIDEQGRDIVQMDSNIAVLLDIAQAIAQIDLGVTIRRAYDTFREQVTAVLIEWLLDLTRSRLGFDTLALRELLVSELLSPRKDPSVLANVNAGRNVPDLHDSARLDWLFVYHGRLWKKPRLNLKEVYASLLTLSHEHKLAIGKFAREICGSCAELHISISFCTCISPNHRRIPFDRSRGGNIHQVLRSPALHSPLCLPLHHSPA